MTIQSRLVGLDAARYLAFVGMVIVNFKMVMGAKNDPGLLNDMTTALQGRAAATFIVLAGIGLGLSTPKIGRCMHAAHLKRVIFLLGLGLMNMLIFDADIIHYYAFYFLFGGLLISVGNRTLIGIIVALNLTFTIMALTLEYDAGWNWTDYTYVGFWTPTGFIRNLFFNGWHPVVPWLGFLIFGIVLARMPLIERWFQKRLMLGGLFALGAASGLSAILTQVFISIDPEMGVLATTEPVPPFPLYTLAGLGTASLVIGFCLLASDRLERWGVLRIISPAGRQTLTLYIAHIIFGMGTLQELNMLGCQTINQAVTAAIMFCALATFFALLWARWFKRGPIEALMRAMTG